MASRIQGMTVEIGGDTTKLQTALKGVNSEIKNTQTQLKDVEKLLKLDPGNTELLAQKHKLLGDAVSETKTKLDTLKIASEQANKALAKGDISQQQYDALQREIIATTEELKKLGTQADSSSVSLEKIAVAGDKLKNVGDNITDVGKKVSVVSVAAVGLGTVATSTFTNFDDSMRQVKATMKATDEEFELLSNAAKGMGASTRYSASEAADALNYLALAGYDTEKAISTLPEILDIAAAGGIDLAYASDVVTDSMAALGLEGSQLTEFTDKMAKASQKSNQSVSQLGEATLTVGGTAKVLSGGITEMNTVLGIFADSGVKGSEGGTALRNVILSLTAPTDKASNTLEELGVSVSDAEGNMRPLNEIFQDLSVSLDGVGDVKRSEVLNNIFNKVDLKSVNALLANSGERFDELAGYIDDSNGAASEMSATMEDGLGGSFRSLSSALEGALIAIGEQLAPMVKNIAENLTGLTQSFINLPDGVQKAIVIVGLFIVALGPVLIIIGQVVGAIGTIMTVAPMLATAITTVKTAFLALNATMLANPIVLIITAIVALVAAFVYLWNTSDGFRQFWIDLWESIKETTVVVWGAIKDFFSTTWESIKVVAETVWTGIKDFFSILWEGIKVIFETVLNVIVTIITFYFETYKLIITTALKVIQTVITTVWTAIQTVISTILDVISTVITTAWALIQTTITTVLTVIQTLITIVWTAIQTVITTIITAVSEFITTAWTTIQTVITTILTVIQTVITTIWTAIQTFLTTIITTISEFIITMWTTIQTTMTTLLNAILTVATTVWNAILTTITTVFNTILTTSTNVWNTIKNTVVTVANTIKSTVTNAFNSLLSTIRSTMTNMYNVIKSGFDNAMNYIKNLASQGYTWGADMIKGIVNGIKSSVGSVKDAVKNVASTMKSYLHFSVPDVGPLTDYETWMPDFMEGLAKGIDTSKYMVTNAVKGLASDMILNPNVATESAMSGSTTLSSGSSGSALDISSLANSITEAVSSLNSQSGDIVIPVYVGGQMLDEVIVTAQQRTNLRSGGR